MKPTDELYTALSRCPLFSDVSRKAVDRLLGIPGVLRCSFEPHEEIPLLCGDERALVILTHGLALAYSTDAERSVILRTIPPGTAFGVSILFSDEAPVSIIRAKTESESLRIPSHVVQTLIDEDPAFRRNYIAFLSGRIRFLNRRIACYTAGSAERRLALYLADLPKESSGVARLDLPLTDLCEVLDIGRASLYRAFARLSDCGLIERDERHVRLLDVDGLRRYGSAAEANTTASDHIGI